MASIVEENGHQTAEADDEVGGELPVGNSRPPFSAKLGPTTKSP